MRELIRLVVADQRECRWQQLEWQWQRLVQQYGASGVLWLTATAAQAEHWQGRWPHHKTTILPLQSFADVLVQQHHCGWVGLDDGERDWRVWQVAQRCAERLGRFGSVYAKRGVVQRMSHTLAELEAAGISAEMLETYLASGEEGNWQSLALVYRQWEQQGQATGLLSAWQRQRLAADFWYRGQRDPFASVRAVVVSGYVELPRTAALLLESLAESGVEVWGEAPQYHDPQEGIYRGWSVLGDECVQLEEVKAGPALSPRHCRIIGAAGALGEARCVLRLVRQWLDAGVPAQRIVLASHEITSRLAQIYEEVAADYGVPLYLERWEPLLRIPAVAFMLLALRVPAQNWQPTDVAALLQHSYFQPDWPELQYHPLVRYAAGLLLRQIGVAEGQRSLERMVERWSDTHQQTKICAKIADPEKIINPEEIASDATSRLRTEKAVWGRPCRDLMRRVFRHYNALAQYLSGSMEAAAAVAALAGAQMAATDRLAPWRAFAAGLGVRPERLSPPERRALERLWEALVEMEPQIKRGDDWSGWWQAATLASQLLQQRLTSAAPGVRLVPVAEAAGLSCDYLVLINMGEQATWLRPGPPASLLREGLRRRLSAAGLPLQTSQQQRLTDQLLFTDLTNASLEALVFSYPSSDYNGQSLMPAAWLRDWCQQRDPSSYQQHQQRMLLDGYRIWPPLAASEQRIAYAQALATGEAIDARYYPAVTPEQAQALQRVQQLATARFRCPHYTPYEGWLQQPEALEIVQQLFGGDYSFSPTAVETYLQCPFRFFARYLLGVGEQSTDVDEQMERRLQGLVLHDALAHFHRELHQELTSTVGKEVSIEQLNAAESHWVSRLETLIDQKVDYYSPQDMGRLTEEVWQRDKMRLRRYARRYWRQWQQWLEKHRQTGRLPLPVACEHEIEVVTPAACPEQFSRLKGRLDRVDRSTDGAVWIIDYKTGRAAEYTSNAVERLERLQLSAYAWAWEQQQQAKGHQVQVHGLVYWFVMGDGAKQVWPSGSASSTTGWHQYRQRTIDKLQQVVLAIRRARFPVAPRQHDCTTNCPFATMCRISQRPSNKEQSWTLDVVTLSSQLASNDDIAQPGADDLAPSPSGG
jgi:RecB family exonuclease